MIKDNNINSRVLVAMSGGVDSSVAAALLKEQGCDVIGITMQIWGDKVKGVREEGRGGEQGGCCSNSAVEDANRVAQKLGIPHYAVNFRKTFEEKVIKNFVSEYRAGRTPNPCVRCNQFIKWGELLKKADELGAKFIATGHYARISTKYKVQSTKNEIQGAGGRQDAFKLLKGVDGTKDQSYALYMLSQEQLGRTIFPIGDMKKTEVRAKAREIGLPVADKDESQEICFVEDNNYGGFIEAIYPVEAGPGPILDADGNVIGEHRGIIHYTIGQRRGLGIASDKPLYVVGIDKKLNAIIAGTKEHTLGVELKAAGISYVSGAPPRGQMAVTAKIRYNAPEAPAVLYPGDDLKARVRFESPQAAINPGQSVVFFSGEEVLGGGIIEEKLS